jgi:hypothetical protein
MADKDGSIRLSKDEALVLDALFRRWQTGDFGDTLKVADETERFCAVNLAADIEGVAMDDLLGEGYPERLQEARENLRRKHGLSG